VTWLLQQMLQQQTTIVASISTLTGEFRAFRDEAVWRMNRAEVREWHRANKAGGDKKPPPLSWLKELTLRDLVWVVAVTGLALAGQFLEVARAIVGIGR
jgi:hypothetical protein